MIQYHASGWNAIAGEIRKQFLSLCRALHNWLGTLLFPLQHLSRARREASGLSDAGVSVCTWVRFQNV